MSLVTAIDHYCHTHTHMHMHTHTHTHIHTQLLDSASVLLHLKHWKEKEWLESASNALAHRKKLLVSPWKPKMELLWVSEHAPHSSASSHHLTSPPPPLTPHPSTPHSSPLTLRSHLCLSRAAGKDYTSFSKNCCFAARAIEAVCEVPLINDQLCGEDDVTFAAKLSPKPDQFACNDVAMVTIKDDDGELALGYLL